ncbi:MAG: YciI family protein [Candidatus Sulfotelmatobacter sp.]
MKYILLMTGTRAGVDTYRAWNKNDIDTHMAGLRSLVKDLRESGEYIADQGLTGPEDAKVVRGQKKGMPITDGIFPESKEFLLGYWIVDVSIPERAYAIAAQLSAMPGPGGVPANMPIEVRQFATHPLKWS